MAANSSSRDRKGEVVGMEFKPAKGGLVSETRTKFKRGGQGGGPLEDYEHETAVHPTMKHAQDHLAATMGYCCPDTEEEPGEAADEEPGK